MTGKRFVIALCILAIVGALCGCKKKEEKDPQGIFKIGDAICYRFILDDQEVEDCFSLTNPQGKVALSMNGDRTGQAGSVANYSAIKEGGWIAYAGNRILYFPETVKKETVQIRCGDFTSLVDEDYLSFEEAQLCLPWLGNP